MMSRSSEVPLSIVVVSFNQIPLLERCLASLADQAAEHGAEILVVRAADAAGEGGVEGRYPVRRLSGPPGETVPRLRQRGLRAATGAIVALLEDDCVVAHDWCRAVLEAHREPWVAIGGAVEPGAYARARDWAVYFYEYGRFMLPFAPHGSVDLPGNNVSYKRQAVLAENDRDDGFIDLVVHSRLSRAGQPLRHTPSIVVTHQNSWPFSHLTIGAYHHGRGFSATRVDAWTWLRRVGFATLTVALPLVQITRIARRAFVRGRLHGRLLVALPWLAVFATSWAIGESVGYLFGPGRSLEHWR